MGHPLVSPVVGRFEADLRRGLLTYFIAASYSINRWYSIIQFKVRCRLLLGCVPVIIGPIV